MNPNEPGITGLILAGGRGSRMGGVDKGLQNFRGLPLALQTLMRLQLQSLPPQEILINANRNLAAYESLGVPVWPDSIDGFAGPLAGFLTGLERCETPGQVHPKWWPQDRRLDGSAPLRHRAL
jgi:molybdopterin-guanine dinucleotide biosynthesis protein A